MTLRPCRQPQRRLPYLGGQKWTLLRPSVRMFSFERAA